MSRLGVVGWPVAHSRSPALQNAALAACGLGASWRYQLLPVGPSLLAETVRALPGQDFRGVNVTIPHKHAALALASTASEQARAIGAANTLLFEPDGTIHAENTDAPALGQALSARCELSGERVLVLGAGGSARAAVHTLLAQGAWPLVWNRTPARAHELCAQLGGEPIADPATIGECRAIVNCTSVGLTDRAAPGTAAPAGAATATVTGLPVDRALLSRVAVLADFVYRPGGTPLLRCARAAGVATIDGLELLIGQGALAFTLFTGLAAPVAVMRTALGLSSAPDE